MDISVNNLRGRVLGRCLVKMRVLTREDLCKALRQQKTHNDNYDHIKLGQVLIDLKLITEEELNFALAGQKGEEYAMKVSTDEPIEDRFEILDL